MFANPSNLPKQKVELLPDAEYNKEWPQEKSYKLLKRFNDPRFGDVSVIKNNANQVVIVKEKMASSKNEVTEDIKALKQRFDMNHPHLLKLIGYSAVTNKELCSTTYITKGFYEFPRSDAYKELSDRQKAGGDFNQSELTHLAYQILSALHSIHQKGFAHGDVRPQLIGYDKQQNHFDLLDRLGDPSPIERCQTNLIINNKELYISPQLYKKLKGKDKTAVYNAQKNDVYALGLSLLYLGEGKSIQNIYQPTGEIDKRLLQEHVMDFDVKHNQKNPLLCVIVKEMLETDESRRKDLRLILSGLPSYEEFKSNEARGIPMNMNNPNPPPRKVQAPPNEVHAPVTEPAQEYNFFDDKYPHQVESQPRYQFPVEENDDVGGYNPYTIKTNQVNSAPQQYKPAPQHTNPQQYQQPPQQVYNNVEYQHQPQQIYHTSEYMPQVTTTTYVRSTPQQLHTYSQYPQTNGTYVQNAPVQYEQPHFVQSPTRYVQSVQNNPVVNNPNTYFDENGAKVIRRSYNAAPVEVRRGTPAPTPAESKVIKKRYVMREDGTVVEIDPNVDMNADDIRKYFDNSYTKDTIAQFESVDHALKSDTNGYGHS